VANKLYASLLAKHFIPQSMEAVLLTHTTLQNYSKNWFICSWDICVCVHAHTSCMHPCGCLKFVIIVEHFAEPVCTLHRN